MDARELSQDANLFDFFHEQVGSAANRSSSEFSDEGVFYLTNLLVERARLSGLEESKTLVELGLKAAHGTRQESIQTYRHLGDLALYMTGFFRQRLERQNVGVNYYLEMGAMAYHRLSRLLAGPEGLVIGESGHKSLDAIFEELAHRYSICSEILRDVKACLRAQCSDHSDQALLSLYEEWLKTGSPHVARRLQELGFIMADSDSLEA